MITDEYRYKIFKIIELNPDISQRELADKLGVSLGKANYCLKALIDKGMLKATNFRNSRNKRAYLYKLTPKGIEEKANVTARFLKRKIQEYELLQAEIKQIRNELDSIEKFEKQSFSS
jgi:EPS-associated MarR family transcriptional regulator